MLKLKFNSVQRDSTWKMSVAREETTERFDPRPGVPNNGYHLPRNDYKRPIRRVLQQAKDILLAKKSLDAYYYKTTTHNAAHTFDRLHEAQVRLCWRWTTFTELAIADVEQCSYPLPGVRFRKTSISIAILMDDQCSCLEYPCSTRSHMFSSPDSRI